MKALILEDNANLGESLRRLITEQGLEVRLKHSWGQASSLIDSDHFDVIVLDILLPDKKGFEVLKILSEKNIMSKVALISGLFNEEVVLKKIPENLKENCRFFKKPIDEQAFLKFIKESKGDLASSDNSFIKSFFEKSALLKPLSFYFSEGIDFDSKELIPLVFFAHLKKFTGDLKIQINEKVNSIHFFKGRIIKVVSKSKKSFLGELLVEHGLSLQEDIELLLKQKSVDKRIGEFLVEKELLSPHMLNFVLKEQVKIRLSEFISYPSFKLKIKEKNTMDVMTQAEIDFNDFDFIEWLADSMQTELNDQFLNEFYLKVQDDLLYKSSQLNIASIYQKKYLKKYNQFFKTLKEGLPISEVLKKQEDDSSELGLLYFGLLTKSIYLKQGDKKYSDYKSLESFIDVILSKKDKSPFEVFSLSEQTLPIEIERKYKQIARKIHPDSLPEGIQPFIKKKAKQAFLIVTESYEAIKSESNRKEYEDVKNKDQFLTVIEQYEEGLLRIKEEKFKEAHAIFLKIKKHSQAPSNTTLYTLWAQMKREDVNLFHNKNEAVQIQKTIEKCPISLRTSSLFWFVKGLFCLKTKQYQKAKELFTKTLLVQKDFIPAKKELIAVKSKLSKFNKQLKGKNIFSFLKKSS